MQAKHATESAQWVPKKKAVPLQPRRFDSWDNAIPLHSAKMLDRLAKDCAAVFTARTASYGEHSTGSTYWIPAGVAPRCALEQVAAAVLAAHAPPDAFVNAGAEWWTLAVDAEDSGIGFHWDLDYEAEGRCGVHRTPFAATVTYLCDTGVPTMCTGPG